MFEAAMEPLVERRARHDEAPKLSEALFLMCLQVVARPATRALQRPALADDEEWGQEPAGHALCQLYAPGGALDCRQKKSASRVKPSTRSSPDTEPNESRRHPSPLRPKAAPGMVTMCASSSKRLASPVESVHPSTRSEAHTPALQTHQ